MLLQFCPSDIWKTLVLTVFKVGKEVNPHEYRPISVLPCISQVFEKHICNQRQEFFNKTNVLLSTQSGFKKGHSCQTALLHLVNKWVTELDKGNMVGTLFLDLSKAFDFVNHDLL